MPYSTAESPYYGWNMISYYNGFIYFVNYNSNIIEKVLATTGSINANLTLNGQIDTVPTIGGNVMLVGFSNLNSVSAISLSSDSALWSLSVDSPIGATASYAGGNFYFGTLGGYMYSVSSSGRVNWKTYLGSSVQTTPVVTGDSVYVATIDGKIYCLTASGDVSWVYRTNSQITTSPLVSSDGVVYDASEDGYIYALNSSTGSLIWQYQAKAPVISSLLLNNDNLYAVDEDGNIYAFEAGCNLVFSESGLARGVNWSVTVGNETKSSSSSTIAFALPPGTYSYSISAVSGYILHPSSGSVSLSASRTVLVSYEPIPSVTFFESGLPPGTSWSVTL
ncbi:MAG: PQQ-binding-like beta-propeller repeat protein, partial [TACK group archaeon]|nr:PQQ-binding-like beta-propeller repeat protein [TACK group archaeon]